MNGFTVRSGNPTPEEIAIALSVLHAAAGARAASESHHHPRTWAAPSRQHRTGEPHRFGRGMWTLAQRMR